MGQFTQKEQNSNSQASLLKKSQKIKSNFRERSRSTSTTRSVSEVSVSSIAPRLRHNLTVNNSNNSMDSFNGKSDDTDSQTDDNERLLKGRFRNNSKSKYLECRSKFKVENRGKEQIGICNTCNDIIKMSSNSDGNLRTHLAYKHGKPEFLTKSQLKAWNYKKNGKIENLEGIKLTPNQKRELKEKLVDSIIEDSRAFNDFAKSGMKNLFNYLLPGFKPPSHKTIRKMIKRRYI
jgi:hypothetical protein